MPRRFAALKHLGSAPGSGFALEHRMTQHDQYLAKSRLVLNKLIGAKPGPGA
jgi:hypothetical protein